MKKNITGLTAFIMYFILVMFLPLLAVIFETNTALANNNSLFDTFLFMPSVLLMLPILFKLQWLLLILPTIILKKRTKNPLLINLFTNLKLNNRILIFGIIFDIFVVIFTQTLNLYDTFYNILYLLYISFTSNYIVIYLIVLLHKKKQDIKNCLNQTGRYISENFTIVEKIRNFKYFPAIKNITGLAAFILFFIFVMFLPLIVFQSLFINTENSSLFLIFLSALSIILFIPIILKVQWLILLLVADKIRQKTKNPLLISLFTNLKLNNIILCYGLIFDIYMCIYATDFIENHLFSTSFYCVYMSFTSNFIVIYMMSLPSKKQTTSNN